MSTLERDTAMALGLDPTADSAVAVDKTRTFSPLDVVGPLLVFAGLIGLWYVMHHWGMRNLFDKPPSLLPPPHQVLYDSFVRRVPLGDGRYFVARDELFRGFWGTTRIAALGLGCATVLGISLAVAMRKRWVERSVWPYLIALQAIPIIAISPLLGSIFGTGTMPRVVVCTMLSIFPIVSNTLFGLQSVDRTQHDLFTVRRVPERTRLFRLEFPAAMPAIFAGFRISAGMSVIGAVVGEQFFRSGSGTGLGIVMEKYRSRALWPLTYGALFLACVLGIAVFVGFTLLSKFIVGRWHESGRQH